MSLLKDLNSLITGTIDRNLYEIGSENRLVFINYTITNMAIVRNSDSDKSESLSLDIEFDYNQWVLTFQHITDISKVTAIPSSVVYKFLKDSDAEVFDQELLTLFLLGYINE